MFLVAIFMWIFNLQKRIDFPFSIPIVEQLGTLTCLKQHLSERWMFLF